MANDLNYIYIVVNEIACEHRDDLLNEVALELRT